MTRSADARDRGDSACGVVVTQCHKPARSAYDRAVHFFRTLALDLTALGLLAWLMVIALGLLAWILVTVWSWVVRAIRWLPCPRTARQANPPLPQPRARPPLRLAALRSPPSPVR